MLTWKQKILLETLNQVPEKRASKLQLMKWLFLLKMEEKVDRFGSFYDFLPYKFGPFSFAIYDDIKELSEKGAILVNSINIINNYGTIKDIKADVTMLLKKVVAKYTSLSQRELIDYVYNHYPWYASKSKIAWKSLTEQKQPIDHNIYTMGYEGFSVDLFFNILLKKRVRTLIDIRNNAVSRKRGFSGKYLEKRCNNFQIEYCHRPEIGIQSEIRNKFDNKPALLEYYFQYIINNQLNSLTDISNSCKDNISVLLCFEKNPYECHRHIVAREISKLTDMPIWHYILEEKTWRKEKEY